jgi:tryptophan synthase alpha chain
VSGKQLVIYLMCRRDTTPALVEAAVEGGADLVELGFPFSDPLADGPVIRTAGERALAEGMRTRACLECLAETRARVDVPLVPMTYAALLEAYGWERFAADVRDAGATSIMRASGRRSAACSSSRPRRPTSGSGSRASRRTAGSTSSR